MLVVSQQKRAWGHGKRRERGKKEAKERERAGEMGLAPIEIMKIGAYD